MTSNYPFYEFMIKKQSVWYEIYVIFTIITTGCTVNMVDVKGNEHCTVVYNCNVNLKFGSYSKM